MGDMAIGRDASRNTAPPMSAPNRRRPRHAATLSVLHYDISTDGWKYLHSSKRLRFVARTPHRLSQMSRR
ncbi:hypothetical protein FA95DRAFT_1559366 [Auriscalpium vulgare]|uniref:Uncharacterized protein n=1 Tax=Auriscalpium vulgare TaxID=40419 RepID=A0ACB8RTW7_9AGAM|nr:hypothetical protein FA95DRAFT_1559366 [Auriscalpium vulgare]